MGCAQSRIENEESVSRCKDRKQFMRDAVTARNAFAAAHSSYTMALKNSGAALSDFGLGESHHPSSQSSVPTVASSSAASVSAVEPPIESLPPPPPPLPDFSPSPLKRAASMPEIPKKFQHSKVPVDATISEEIEEEAETEERREQRNDEKAPESTPDPPPPPPPDSRMGTWDYFFANYDGLQGGSLQGEEIEEPVTPEKGVVDPPPPPPPPPETPPMMTPPEGLPPRPEKKKAVNVHHQHAASEGAVEMKMGKMVDRTGVMEKMSVSLLQVLMDLDDHFLKASEGAHEVSKMLEANRMHYHSNFADNRGTFCNGGSSSFCLNVGVGDWSFIWKTMSRIILLVADKMYSKLLTTCYVE